MGNKSKRPGMGKTSELVAASNVSAMAAIAVLVDAMGGRLQVSYADLAIIADKVNLQVTTTETHVVYTTRLKPQILKPGLVVPEGPAGLADLGSDSVSSDEGPEPEPPEPPCVPCIKGDHTDCLRPPGVGVQEAFCCCDDLEG